MSELAQAGDFDNGIKGETVDRFVFPILTLKMGFSGSDFVTSLTSHQNKESRAKLSGG